MPEEVPRPEEALELLEQLKEILKKYPSYRKLVEEAEERTKRRLEELKAQEARIKEQEARELLGAMGLPGVTPPSPTPGRRVLFGGKGYKGPTPVMDTKTGKVYHSKTEAGKALAREYGFDPNDRFVYYKIIYTDPGRLKDLPE